MVMARSTVGRVSGSEARRGAAIGVVLALCGAALGVALAASEGERPCGVGPAIDDAVSAAELGLPGPEGLAVDDSWGALGP